MNIRIYFTTLLFVACTTATIAQQNNSLSLQQCIDMAIKNNLQVKQSGLNAESAKINFLQAKENLLPTITASAGRQLNQGRGINTVTNTYVNQSLTSDNYNLSGSLTLFNGLSYQNAVKQASLAYQANTMDFQAAKDVVTINVITSYLLVLNNQELLEQSKKQLQAAKEQTERAETLEKEGANKTASDLADLKGTYAGSKVTLVNAENALNAAKLSLYQVMNVPYNKDAELQPLNAQELTGTYAVSADKVYETALQQLALVKAATLKRESAEKGVKAAKGQMMPTLYINGGLNTTYSSATQGVSYTDQIRNNYGNAVGLGLNIPLFTNHIKKNNVSLAKINLLNAQYVEDATKTQLRQTVEQAYNNMTSAYNKYQALDEQVKAYTESFRVAKIRFEAGVLTSVDFVIAKNNMDNANLNWISARYDYFIYSKILDYYQGKLSSL